MNKTLPLRGALIVVEGCDRAGKTTQCKDVVNALQKSNIPAEYMNFPDRKTSVGKLIHNYLTNQEDFPDRTIHLLFSANRWEFESKIEKLLNIGTTVIIDRYAFSGVAFSAIKPGMDLNWCKQSDAGLPKPDLVLLLALSADQTRARGGFGEERYEEDSTQRKVKEMFEKMKDSTWKEVNANRSVEEVKEELLTHIKSTLEKCRHSPIGKLW